MSARTKGAPTSQALTSKEGLHAVDSPDVFHVYLVADLEMSDRYGIEVRSLCGCWGLPGEDEGGPLEGNAFPRPVRLCKRCTRTRAYRQ